MGKKIIATFDGEKPDEVAVLINEDGNETIRHVDAEEFLESALRSVKYDGKKTRSGGIPSYCYDFAIGNDGSFALVQVVPERKLNLIQFMDEEHQIGLPALCFYTEVNRKGAIKRSSVYALDTNNPTDESVLYHFPLGNVYEDGHICWGNSTVLTDEYHRMSDLSFIPDCFIGTKTNRDLWKAGVNFDVKKAKLTDSCIEVMYAFLDTKEEFPKEFLVETELTLGKLLKAWE